LQSKRNKRYYIGSTVDLARRIIEHKGGRVKSTKGILPVELVFSQEYDNITKARSVELRIKRLKRRDYVEKIIANNQILFSRP
jgi:putative endonuclease